MGIYMKYGSILGDATQQGFQQWINIKEVHWTEGNEAQASVKRNFDTRVGRGRNREPKQPVIGTIKIHKDVDHATGNLLKTICTEIKGEQCQIAFVRTGDPGETYLQYTMTDTLLAAVRMHGVDRPSEEWTLDFTEIEVEVKQLDEANQSEVPFHFTYSIATGKGQ